ncbi:nucleoside deaminase [Planosporangium thailandense]|uniref:Nucleoside deaminase n=1 Tax=Planosporangium thailandense TaxID=765197 RepID=A0ABX0XT89_9ACTN|nr:nucleoside deaminase [Planosporangium thailandense]NJC69226.1 nucleoside deaminase [Planosporangium thailandense]
MPILLDGQPDTFFEAALREAEQGLAEGGVPIGAALAMDGELLAVGRNLRVQKDDPIAHGEMSCLRNAGRRQTYKQTTLYTTLSPCEMCSGAILLFGIKNVVVGEATTFPGNLTMLSDRGVNVTLLSDPRCVRLMTLFQERHPEVWAEDIGRA